MKIVFFGNTKYSVIVAKTLFNEYGVSSVVTIPDRPLGRKKILTPSPVKQFAINNKIHVLTFDKLDDRAIAKISRSVIPSPSTPLRTGSVEESHTSEPVKRDPSTRPAASVGTTWERPDFLVVADYGLILPKQLLDAPKYAPLNVHHSLLPKYRGPSPAPTAILNGDKVSGVTVIKMTEKVDAGPILAQKEYALKADETTDSLLTTLNTLGGELVVDVIKNYKSIKPVPQDELKATITSRMNKEDGYIDLENPPSAEKLDRMIRAYYPWPTVWTTVTMNRKQLTNKQSLGPDGLNKLAVKSQPPEASLARLASKRAKSGKLEVRIKFLPGNLIQVEGGKPMSLKDFLNGYPEMKSFMQKLFVSRQRRASP